MADAVRRCRNWPVDWGFLHRLGAPELGVGIGQAGIVEIRRPRAALLIIQIGDQILRDEAVKQHPEHIAFEVPPIDTAAQIVGNTPDGSVQLGALDFFYIIHRRTSPLAPSPAGSPLPG